MERPDYRMYHLKMTVLSPLHIGNGREMLKDYDYAVYNGRTWRIDENALLDLQQIEDTRIAEMLVSAKPAQLIKAEDFQEGSPLFRYVLKGTPKSQAEGAVVRECLKDAFDRPYIPGSSLKGALRTALAVHLWQVKKMQPEIARLNPSPKFAAEEYERELFGKNPNHDLLRAFQVRDSAPLSPTVLMLVNARVINASGKLGSPVELEAIRRDTEIRSEIKLDTALFSQWAKSLGFQLPNRDALFQFVAITRQRSLRVIQRELAWAKKLPNGKHIVDFYQNMLAFQLPESAFFLQVGWGGGWEQKTFGEQLKRDTGFMQTLLKPRSQKGWDVGRGHIPKNVEDFPTSRRVAMAYQRNAQGEIVREVPALPLGWMLVEVLGA
ncbi:MAG: type III-A CRISPR-associated RAMP protein Csm5 [Anaerolineales bacterium]|nr:type III-A CRISPR-associated RAMP protein Csm5 [Anaerolineales bacterium]MDW8161081.1 type III-A CRISPR-associated RAMP protein Csm5 [Anaerolineales bacterium]